MSELPRDSRWGSSLSPGDNWFSRVGNRTRSRIKRVFRSGGRLRPDSTTPDSSNATSSISVAENSPFRSPLSDANPGAGIQRPKSAPPPSMAVDEEFEQPRADGNCFLHDHNPPESSVTRLDTSSQPFLAPSSDLPVTVSPAVPEIFVLPIGGTANGGNDTPQQDTAVSLGCATTPVPDVQIPNQSMVNEVCVEYSNGYFVRRKEYC
ncbi:hypothetical protein K440DRAFT_661467 [Wilcoxina mikolae CBS 423.85]|nr:hypothetical protein K440DRAFT_661467 [Wilcoxina mikolae CBS 423.85]